MVIAAHAQISIVKQCWLLSVARSTYYYQPVPISPEIIELRRRIDELFTEQPTSGSRAIRDALRLEGRIIGRKSVRRHMREMGLLAIYPKINLSKRNLKHKIHPYLLRGLHINRINQVWSIDITYLRMEKSWMYLVAIVDWYSRKVISWEIDQTLSTGFVIKCVNSAIAQSGTPEIINGDQGSQFTSDEYIDLLKAHSIKVSMDGKGRATDNNRIERFWRSLKQQAIYLNEIDSPFTMRRIINEYADYYNERRPHQSLQGKTPSMVYNGLYIPIPVSYAKKKTKPLPEAA